MKYEFFFFQKEQLTHINIVHPEINDVKMVSTVTLFQCRGINPLFAARHDRMNISLKNDVNACFINHMVNIYSSNDL